MRRFALPLVLILAAGCGNAADDPPAAEGGAETPDDPPPVVVEGGSDVWLAPLSAGGSGVPEIGEARNVTNRPAQYDNQPHFLPDGSGLLYTAGDEEGRTDIHLLRLPGGESERLTRTPEESEFSPTPLVDGGFSVIRVEPDGTQRLWRFEADGSDPELLLPDVAPVGYQGWIDADRVGLFVLGDPATLQVASVATGEAQLAFESVGPSVQPIPGREAVSFVEVDGDESWIREYDGATGETRRLEQTPDGGSDHAWTPGGVLLMASGRRILAHVPGEPGWREVGEPGPEGVAWSRLAVGPDGARIALVGEPADSP